MTYLVEDEPLESAMPIVGWFVADWNPTAVRSTPSGRLRQLDTLTEMLRTTTCHECLSIVYLWIKQKSSVYQ